MDFTLEEKMGNVTLKHITTTTNIHVQKLPPLTKPGDTKENRILFSDLQ